MSIQVVEHDSFSAEEVRDLANSSQETASRIQEMNTVVTAAVHNLSESAQHLVDYMSQSVLTEFQSFVASGSQYKEDAAYIHQARSSLTFVSVIFALDCAESCIASARAFI